MRRGNGHLAGKISAMQQAADGYRESEPVTSPAEPHKDEQMLDSDKTPPIVITIDDNTSLTEEVTVWWSIYLLPSPPIVFYQG